MLWYFYETYRNAMKLENIDVTDTIEKAKKLLAQEKRISPAFKAVIEILLIIVSLMVERLSKNSRNSSIPPSQDPNRAKTSQADKTNKKPGGQLGRVGKTLVPFETPDEIIEVPVDRTKLPSGHIYKNVGFTKRQIVEVHLSRYVKEYRLEILENEKGKRFTAEGSIGMNRPIQYGSSVKAMAVYLNIYQLIPYGRVEEYFTDQVQIPLSAGSLYNFNEEAFDLLKEFESIAQKKLQTSAFLHHDETGINVNGKGYWLHGALNDEWTLFMPHKSRGKEAMDDMNILPWFKGIAIHDHWFPYFRYTECRHALCNAHHLRELQAVVEKYPNQTWALLIKALLLEINKAVHEAGGVLSAQVADGYRERYRKILEKGHEECPLPLPPSETQKKRGKTKKTKERNLLERLKNYETEALRFMETDCVPFTNNPGENDIRMTKVHQKISGCFKSFKGAQIFCRVRSYLLTCQKHGITATDALNTLFSGNLPYFCSSDELS